MTNASNDGGLRVLAVFNCPGPIRLAEVVAALNPRPRPKWMFWFGGPVLDRWCERNAEIFATVASLAGAGMLEQAHHGRTLGLRRDQYRDRYAITEAGWYTLTGTQFANVETRRSPDVTEQTYVPDPQALRKLAREAVRIAIRQAPASAIDGAITLHHWPDPVPGKRLAYHELVAAEYDALVEAVSWPDESARDAHDALLTAVEVVLLDHQAEIGGDEVDPNIAELAHCLLAVAGDDVADEIRDAVKAGAAEAT